MVERKTAAFVRMVLKIVVFLMMLCSVSVKAADSTHVFDAADLFDVQQVQEMETLAQKLEDEYKMNVLLLTTWENYSGSSAALAEAFYEDENYDTNGRRGGIVLLIDIENRELCLVTNGDMIYYITDEREERIYDAGYAYAAKDAYAEAMLAMLQKTADYLEQGIPDNQYTYDTETGRIVRHRSLDAAELLLAFGAALLAAGAACYGVCRKYSAVKAFEYDVSRNADMHLKNKRDQLMNQFVTQRRIPRNPPHTGDGSGSGGGRTSTHHSAGGGTFGGGHGRKF